jgi:hypothetical protein
MEPGGVSARRTSRFLFLVPVRRSGTSEIRGAVSKLKDAVSKFQSGTFKKQTAFPRRLCGMDITETHFIITIHHNGLPNFFAKVKAVDDGQFRKKM